MTYQINNWTRQELDEGRRYMSCHLYADDKLVSIICTPITEGDVDWEAHKAILVSKCEAIKAKRS